MKKLRKIILWILIGVILETGGFLYINNYYLTKNLIISSKTIVSDKPAEVQLFKPSVNISDIKISDDEKYAAYFEGGQIVIVDLSTKEEEKINAENGYELQLFKWMPYEDEVFYLEKPKAQGILYKLESYAITGHKVDLDVKLDFQKTIGNQFGVLSSKEIPKNIEDIKTSPGQQGFMIETSNSSNGNNLYSLGRNGQLIMEHNDASSDIKDNESMKSFLPLDISGAFLFQKNNDNRIYSYLLTPFMMKGTAASLNSKQPTRVLSGCLDKLLDISKNKTFTTMTPSLKLDDISNPLLLGTDSQGNLYIGNLENSLVNEIYVYGIYGDNSIPKIYKLDNPITEKDIFITFGGGIYAIFDSKIVNLQNKKQSTYSGAFVQIVGNDLYYLSGGYLIRKSL